MKIRPRVMLSTSTRLAVSLAVFAAGVAIARTSAARPAAAQDAAAADAPVTTPPTASEPAAPAAVAPAPSASPAPASEPVAPAPAAVAADSSVNIKLRSIEERVNELKEKIFQSKARLSQLQEVVLHGAVSGAKAVLVHKNEMGSSFRLRRVQYALDGAPIFNRADAGSDALDELAEFEIFSGAIAPGNHQISVYLEYQGYGFGVFSYLQGYVFRIKSSYTFNAEEGKVTTVQIVGYEKGGITTEFQDRPAVRYDIEIERSLRDEAAKGAAQGRPDE